QGEGRRVEDLDREVLDEDGRDEDHGEDRYQVDEDVVDKDDQDEEAGRRPVRRPQVAAPSQRHRCRDALTRVPKAGHRRRMNKLSIVFVAGLAVAGFGCKKKGGGDCSTAINHSMELSKADMAKMPGMDDKM